jgi:hypothetical protein
VIGIVANLGGANLHHEGLSIDDVAVALGVDRLQAEPFEPIAFGARLGLAIAGRGQYPVADYHPAAPSMAERLLQLYLIKVFATLAKRAGFVAGKAVAV